METFVTYRRSADVATIAMDDGKVNVLTPGMLGQLNDAFDRAEADQVAVVLTGREGVFSAGFDLGTLRAGGPDARAMVRSGFELSARLLAFPAPVVAACSGHAIAMGLFLVLPADYRVGADGPYKITANEVAIGLAVPRAPIEICRLRLAPAHVHRTLSLADIYSPAGAVTAGILDQLVPAGSLAEAAADAAARLAALDRAAHVATKLLVREQALRTIAASIEADARALIPG